MSTATGGEGLRVPRKLCFSIYFNSPGNRFPNLFGLIRQESESIENDQERRAFVEHDGDAQSQSQDARRNEEGDHAEAEPKILPNDAARLSA